MLKYDISRAQAKCRLCRATIGVGERRAFEVVNFFGRATRHYFHIACARAELRRELHALDEFWTSTKQEVEEAEMEMDSESH